MPIAEADEILLFGDKDFSEDSYIRKLSEEEYNEVYNAMVSGDPISRNGINCIVQEMQTEAVFNTLKVYYHLMPLSNDHGKYFGDSSEDSKRNGKSFNLKFNGKPIAKLTSIDFRDFDSDFDINDNTTTKQLKRMLDSCIEHEQYERAAKIRDEINSRD